MSTKNSVSARSVLAVVVGVSVLIGLIWWVGSRFSGPIPQVVVVDGGAPSSRPIARRSPAPPAITTRPRAGISGRVLDPEKSPLSGANVCAWPARSIAAVQAGLPTAVSEIPRCAITDATGAYTLDGLLPATLLDVSAIANGFPPQGFRDDKGERIRLGDSEQRAGVDFVMRAGAVKLRGRVDDLTGGGVAGALVVTDGHDGARSMATSDSKGDFTLWVDPGRVEVLATATGYAPGHAVGPAPDHFFAIHLVPGATLVGHAVIATTETPVVGAMIEAIQVEGGNVRASTQTLEGGKFKIEGLIPGRYRIEATSEGREGYSHSSVTLGMGETSADVLVELDPAYIVRGRVVDKTSGEPCTAGRVTITDDKQNEYSLANIEPDGWARMASVIPGNYKVEVECKGSVFRDDFPRIVITDRDAPDQTWQVEKGARLRVLLVDSRGKPVRGAHVTADRIRDENDPPPSGMQFRRGGLASQPEPDGSFLVTGLTPGRHRVIARTDEHVHAMKEAQVLAESEEKITIEIPISGTIEGVVEDSDHRPVGDITVQASGPGHAVARTLDDGTFRLSGLESGSYVVRAVDMMGGSDDESDDPKRAGGSTAKVTVNAPDSAKVKLQVARRDGKIEGRVVDAKGAPVTDAFIDVTKSEGNGPPNFMFDPSQAPVITDTEGRFKIDRLAAGEYYLRAYRNGGGEGHVDHVKVGTTNLELRLSEGGSISGSLTSRGAPVERFTMDVVESTIQFNREELFFHAGGAFFLRDLPAGTYKVTADTPLGSASTEVTLADGEQKTGIALTLMLNATVEGQVVDAETGRPVAGVWVNFGEHGGVPTDKDGRFHREDIPGGSHTVQIEGSREYVETTLNAEVNQDGATTQLGEIKLNRRKHTDDEPNEPGDNDEHDTRGDGIHQPESPSEHGELRTSHRRNAGLVACSGAHTIPFAPLASAAAHPHRVVADRRGLFR